MPLISDKGKIMPASPIRKLVPFAEAAKEKGINIYHLNIGQPDIKTPTVALEALKKYDEKVIEYSHSAGNISYRKKLVKYYNKNSIDINEDNLLITTGGSEAIIFAFNTCLNYGDEIIVPEPYYANYQGFAISTGVKIIPIRAKIENDFALPQISDFEPLITKKTKAILICNPNNPTGYLYSEKELRQLRELVLKYDLYFFSDEVYREFCYDGKEHFSALRLEGLDEHVVMFDSVSKRYSECGIRIGALVTRNKHIISTALKFGQARLSPPSLGQIVAEASLDVPESYFTEVKKEYVERRNFLVNALNNIPNVYSPLPQGAFYTVVKLPVKDTNHFAQWLLEDFEYKNQTVMVAPASGFYITPNAGKDEVRIAYVLKIEDLRNAVEVLTEALKVYPY